MSCWVVCEELVSRLRPEEATECGCETRTVRPLATWSQCVEWLFVDQIEFQSLDWDADKGRYLGSRLALADSEQKTSKLEVWVNLSAREKYSSSQDPGPHFCTKITSDSTRL